MLSIYVLFFTIVYHYSDFALHLNFWQYFQSISPLNKLDLIFFKKITYGDGFEELPWKRCSDRASSLGQHFVPLQAYNAAVLFSSG